MSGPPASEAVSQAFRKLPGCAIFSAVCSLLLVSACTPATNPLVVERSGDFSKVVKDDNPFAIISQQQFEAFSEDGKRNFQVLRAMSVEDESFREYILKLWTVDASTISGLDMATLGLTAASSLTGGALAKALAATATAVTGTRTSLDKNFFYGKTMDALLYSMVATRARIRDHIQVCLKLPGTQYDLPTALYDIQQYRDAGRIQSAIANVAVSSTGVLASASADCGNQTTGAPILGTAPVGGNIQHTSSFQRSAVQGRSTRGDSVHVQKGVATGTEAERLQAFVDSGVTANERGMRLNKLKEIAIELGFADTRQGDDVISQTGPEADRRRRLVATAISSKGNP